MKNESVLSHYTCAEGSLSYLGCIDWVNIKSVREWFQNVLTHTGKNLFCSIRLVLPDPVHICIQNIVYIILTSKKCLDLQESNYMYTYTGIIILCILLKYIFTSCIVVYCEVHFNH